MNTREELINLKEKTGMNWKKMSEYYGIPYRTIQDWHMGKRNMPEYLLRLMIYKAEIEIISKRQDTLKTGTEEEMQ
ncbi:MAG: transcriptional regulator [Blautia sp.]|nr:transcriptional regulator [Blautia sp.]